MNSSFRNVGIEKFVFADVEANPKQYFRTVSTKEPITLWFDMKTESKMMSQISWEESALFSEKKNNCLLIESQPKSMSEIKSQQKKISKANAEGKNVLKASQNEEKVFRFSFKVVNISFLLYYTG